MMSHHPFPSLRSEGGFTLVELLIAIGIGASLIGAVGTVLVLGLRTTEEAGDQVSEAAWAQIVGNWFLTDVQSAEEVDFPTCGGATGDLVETFTWNMDSPSETQHATWWLDDVGSGGDTVYDLHRTECDTDLMTTRESVIAEGIHDLLIACEEDPDEIPPDDALQCTIAWTFTAGTPVDTMEAGSDTDTIVDQGAFASAVVGEVVLNITRKAFAQVESVDDFDTIQLDQPIADQTEGDSYEMFARPWPYRLTAARRAG